MPPISPEGGWPLALARSLSVAALLSGFGALVFRRVVLPKLASRVADGAVTRLAFVSLAASLPLLSAWAVLQTAALAETGGNLRAIASALPTVIGATGFGHVWLAQVAAVLIGLASLRWRPGAALIPCTAAVILQAGHSHAQSMNGPGILLLSDIVHLLAAGAWLGGLLPLLASVRSLPPRDAASAARWFTPLGQACVAAMAVTALYQGWQLVESLPGLVGTPYGWLALGKLALFGVLFAFAVANRYRFAPALLRGEPVAARRSLVGSISVQTGFGLAIVVAAGILSNLPPSLHEEQIWPFPVRPSLVTVNEDPEFARIVVIALLELAGAGLLLAAALALRRFRITAAFAAAGIAWIALPNLRLLFVPAYPTSFFSSPTDFAATSIVHGAALYAQNCAMCHGASGRGDGPAAASLAIPPADLTQPHLWAHSDGEMFWWLTHGIEGPNGGLSMPGFAAKLNPDDRWTLIDFVRANNAGMARRAGEAWPVPIAAPDLVANCPGGRTMVLTTLRGRAVRLVFAGGTDAAPLNVPGLDVPGLVTITIGPARSRCAATDPAVATAYALVLGTSAASLAGADLMVDPNGWIRLGPPGVATSAAWVGEISAHPLAASGAGHRHEH